MRVTKCDHYHMVICDNDHDIIHHNIIWYIIYHHDIIYHRYIWGNIARKMVPIDLPYVGLPQTFNLYKIHYLWTSTEWSTIKRDMPILEGTVSWRIESLYSVVKTSGSHKGIALFQSDYSRGNIFCFFFFYIEYRKTNVV